MAGYPHGGSVYPYGAPSPQPYAGYPTARAPSAPAERPPKNSGGDGGWGPPSAPYHGAAPGGYGAAPGAYQPAVGYGSPFAALVPSAFPPGADPSVVASFQAADADGSGQIDDKELQRALSSYNQNFGLRTVHLLMYLFTNTNVRKIGEWTDRNFSALLLFLEIFLGV